MTTLFFFFFYIAYAVLLTYLVLGFIISLEIVGVMAGSEYAISWVRKQMSYEEVYWAVIVFYPMLKLTYFFLEYIPSYFTHEIRCEFNLESLFLDLFNPEV